MTLKDFPKHIVVPSDIHKSMFPEEEYNVGVTFCGIVVAKPYTTLSFCGVDYYFDNEDLDLYCFECTNVMSLLSDLKIYKLIRSNSII